MKRSVKILSLALAALLALGLTACHFSTPATVLSVNGTDMPAGVYLMLQLQAYSTAGGKLEGDEKDVLKATIEEKNGADWVHEETLRLVRRYAYLESEFTAQGLSFTEDENTATAKQLETNWASVQENMERNGIGYESYRKFYENEMKYEKLLSTFSEEHKASISDADAKAYMDGLYSHVSMLSLPVTTTEGEAVPDADAQKIADMAQKLADELSAGGDIDALAPETLKQAMEVCGRTYEEDALSQYLTTTFVTEDYLYLPEEMLSKVLEAKVGDAGVQEIGTTPYVYQKIANYKDNADFMNYRDTLVSNMSVEAFDEKVKADSADYTVTEDANAVRTYSPKKIKL